mmetsp:Transcript_10978/g.12670  ORF Transcript_10978/g.12670 Transcript_10978/m.12670 type:complete len:201 (-) Transcript_10978:186-788(-)
MTVFAMLFKLDFHRLISVLFWIRDAVNIPLKAVSITRKIEGSEVVSFISRSRRIENPFSASPISRRRIKDIPGPPSSSPASINRINETPLLLASKVPPNFNRPFSKVALVASTSLAIESSPSSSPSRMRSNILGLPYSMSCINDRFRICPPFSASTSSIKFAIANFNSSPVSSSSSSSASSSSPLSSSSLSSSNASFPLL